jgi:sulfur carrier protein
MRVLLNGRPADLDDEATVAAAVAELAPEAAPRGIAVAVEAEVVPRGEWSTRRLAEGQRVEVLVAVQGG